MEFSTKEQATIVAGLNRLVEDEEQMGLCRLAGGLGTREEIGALIERIEQGGRH